MAARDEERVLQLTEKLKEARLDALFCTLPSNVLLVSGYWPVVGTAVAFFTCEGQSAVLAPKDEEEFAKSGWADQVRFFEPASLHKVSSVGEALEGPLRQLASDLKLGSARIGHEAGAFSEPGSYVASHLYGQERERLLKASAPGANLCDARKILNDLKSVLTAAELEHVRTACKVARDAYSQGIKFLRGGLMETEVANLFRAPLSIRGLCDPNANRADGDVFCMSGTNSAKAYAAYQRSTSKKIDLKGPVLIHCNSYVDGFWTDITRTYLIGESGKETTQLDTLLRARDAALAAIKPGACAADVDEAARSVLREAGLEREFKHATGHGVGFEAINHNARPRIHPRSKDVLKEGMVFNVEPGLYFEGRYGMRHCDMVVVNSGGCELLTCMDQLEDLLLAPSSAA